MDFLTGFIIGYLIKEIGLYLKRLANYKPHPKDDWDWISHDDLP